jgi:hypothetical protein
MCLQARITSGSGLAQVNAGKLIGNSCGLELSFAMRKARIELRNAQGSSDFPGWTSWDAKFKSQTQIQPKYARISSIWTLEG